MNPKNVIIFKRLDSSILNFILTASFLLCFVQFFPPKILINKKPSLIVDDCYEYLQLSQSFISKNSSNFSFTWTSTKILFHLLWFKFIRLYSETQQRSQIFSYKLLPFKLEFIRNEWSTQGHCSLNLKREKNLFNWKFQRKTPLA